MSAGRSLTAQPLVRAENGIGEGPLWLQSSRRLIWTDIFKKQLYCLSPETGQTLCSEQKVYIACCGETDSGRAAWVFRGLDLRIGRDHGFREAREFPALLALDQAVPGPAFGAAAEPLPRSVLAIGANVHAGPRSEAEGAGAPRALRVRCPRRLG